MISELRTLGGVLTDGLAGPLSLVVPQADTLQHVGSALVRSLPSVPDDVGASVLVAAVYRPPQTHRKHLTSAVSWFFSPQIVRIRNSFIALVFANKECSFVQLLPKM